MSRRATTPESSVLRACLALLHLRGVVAWRNNSGMLRNAAGRPVKFGKVGSPDIIGLWPGTGRMLCLEVKRPGGRPTEAQAAFLATIRRHGGVAAVIDDVGKLATLLDALERDPGADVEDIP